MSSGQVEERVARPRIGRACGGFREEFPPRRDHRALVDDEAVDVHLDRPDLGLGRAERSGVGREQRKVPEKGSPNLVRRGTTMYTRHTTPAKELCAYV